MTRRSFRTYSVAYQTTPHYRTSRENWSLLQLCGKVLLSWTTGTVLRLKKLSKNFPHGLSSSLISFFTKRLTGHSSIAPKILSETSVNGIKVGDVQLKQRKRRVAVLSLASTPLPNTKAPPALLISDGAMEKMFAGSATSVSPRPDSAQKSLSLRSRRKHKAWGESPRIRSQRQAGARENGRQCEFPVCRPRSRAPALYLARYPGACAPGFMLTPVITG